MNAAAEQCRIEAACRAFLEGDLEPGSLDGLQMLLCGEGTKRVEAFVFELLFDRNLQHLGMETGSRWMRGSAPDGSRSLWTVISPPEGLGRCDVALINLLGSRQQQVLRVDWGKGERPSGCLWIEGNWTTPEPLASLLTAMFGPPGPYGRVTNIADPDTVRRTADELISRMTGVEALQLARQRVLINHFLRRWSRHQPTDIDAIVLNPSGELRFVEFKRKYPSAQGFLSLDESHVETARWLLGNGYQLTYVVLLDPRRNSNGSALYLLDREYRARVCWLAVDVDEGVFTATLNTEGRDSGMRSGLRIQRGIHVSRFLSIGNGFAPRGLRPFIERAATAGRDR